MTVNYFWNPLAMAMIGSNAMNENLVYDLESAKKFLINYFTLKESDIEYYENKTRVDMGIAHVHFENDIYKKFIKALDYLGYQITAEDENEIYFSEKEIKEDKTDEIKDKHDFLYYVSTKENAAYVLNNGIQPNDPNKAFISPNRAFLYYDDKFINKNDKRLTEGIYTVFKIDTMMLNKNIKLHVDPQYEFGCYTKQDINSNAIISSKILNIVNV